MGGGVVIVVVALLCGPGVSTLQMRTVSLKINTYKLAQPVGSWLHTLVKVLP